MTELQRCCSCGEDKPQDQFPPSWRGQAGKYCRPCNADHQRGYRARCTSTPDRQELMTFRPGAQAALA
jgi:hypothetical protein